MSNVIAMDPEDRPDPRNVRRVKRTVRIKKNKDLSLKDRKRNFKRSKEEKQAIRERQEQALSLRTTGITYKEIATALGYANASSAKNAVDAAIWRTEKEAATEVVALDLARLDEFTMRCMHALRANGDLHQIDRMMRIMEMRYRLLGITDETVRMLQAEHGIVRTTNNMVMNIHAAPETEKEFIRKMMLAVGTNPDSKEAKKLLSEHSVPMSLPMLEGSANDGTNVVRSTDDDGEDEDIVEAVIVEDE